MMSAARIRGELTPAMLAIALSIVPFAVRAAKDPESVARAMYTALARDDVDAVAALLAPDVSWIFHGPSNEIPYAGSFRGAPGVRRFFQIAHETVHTEPLEPRSFVTQEDTVLVRGIENGVAVATDGRFTAHWLHAITVHDGRIIRFEEIIDSAAIADALAPPAVARGQAYFTTCAGCHAPDGHGNRDMNAPNLTGLNSEYLVRQLRNFVSGARGGPTNFYGWQMNGRAKALPGDRAIRDVIAYVSSLAPLRPQTSFTADATRGRKLFGSCVVCHGEQGQGNSSQGGPALVQLDDWYQERQLRDFRSGARGADSSDAAGQQMRAAAAALPDEHSIADVVAYIGSLRN
ncbi:MAG TPA: c-type cytochrome [Steroidobacteraceae bacterium]|nr:c-type cytochrome [Steroidobacteraceae bacterium]